MKNLNSVSLAALIALASFATFAQQVAAPAPAPAMAAPIPMDCAKAPTKRHNHGVDRGLGATAGSKAAGTACGSDDAASAAGNETKKRHDHAKFHKNQ